MEKTPEQTAKVGNANPKPTQNKASDAVSEQTRESVYRTNVLHAAIITTLEQQYNSRFVDLFEKGYQLSTIPKFEAIKKRLTTEQLDILLEDGEFTLILCPMPNNQWKVIISGVESLGKRTLRANSILTVMRTIHVDI